MDFLWLLPRQPTFSPKAASRASAIILLQTAEAGSRQTFALLPNTLPQEMVFKIGEAIVRIGAQFASNLTREVARSTINAMIQCDGTRTSVFRGTGGGPL
jgi:hypothetical protein